MNHPTLLLYAPGHSFVLPYLERELAPKGWQINTNLKNPAGAQQAIMLSSTQIYLPQQGQMLDEQTPIDTEGPWHAYEQLFSHVCTAAGLTPIILRCANTVGTGMQGLPILMARAVARGTLPHLTSKKQHPRALISLVHATTVAQTAAQIALNPQLITQPCALNLTDGTETPVDSLLEALAWRINQKRVGTMPRALARILLRPALWHAMTTTLTYSDLRLRQLFHPQNIPVTQYLKTHIYDDSSL